MTENIAIIGCGYVGSALARRLVASGHHCIATTTSPQNVDRIRETGATPAQFTSGDIDRLKSILDDCSVVFITVAPGRSDQTYDEVYLRTAQTVIQCLDMTPVTRVIYTSSTRVYGQSDGQWVNEDVAPTPGRSKSACSPGN